MTGFDNCWQRLCELNPKVAAGEPITISAENLKGLLESTFSKGYEYRGERENEMRDALANNAEFSEAIRARGLLDERPSLLS